MILALAYIRLHNEQIQKSKKLCNKFKQHSNTNNNRAIYETNVKKKTHQFEVSVKDDNIMTPVKPQISKFRADKILPSGLQRVMAALLMSVC
jgi:hypothetical protein